MTPRSAQPPAPTGSASELSTTYALAQTSFLVQGALERRADERGFSLIQMRLLGVLRDRQPTINDLAKLLGLDKSSVSGLVDRAERRGLVQRKPSTVDRRSVLVTLTEDGRSLASAVSAQFEADIAAMLGALTPSDRAKLTSLLSQMLVAKAVDRGIDLFATTPTATTAPEI